MARAFVLMPFDERFDPIYEAFIVPALREAGLEVARADNIESQRNILKDVMEGIANSDLIIADLTDANPNVYYELGVAHAFRKPVIHLTQLLEDVPFDLRSYRIIEYDTYFSKMKEAEEKLRRYAEAFLAGNLPTGNPVSDFQPRPETGEPHKAGESDDSENEGEPGFLDRIVQVTEGYQQIASLTETATQHIATLGDDVAQATHDFERIAASPSDSSPKALQSVARRLADKVGRFNTELHSYNKEFAEILEKTSDDLESVFSSHIVQMNPSDPTLLENVESLQSFLDTIEGTHTSITGMENAMRSMPKIERRLNREVDRAAGGLANTRSNLDRFMSSISRALNHVGM